MLFDPGCVVCGRRSGPVCGLCRAALQPAEPVTIDGVHVCAAAFALDDRARTIVAAFKYRRQRRLARWLATELTDLVPLAADAITWVPATPERRRTRGFDQAEEVARALARSTGVPARRLLVRHRNDNRQTGLSRRDRAAGPQLLPATTPPEFVVLVDDVITTGSSVRVASAALKSAGTHRVVAIAVAATPFPGDGCLPKSTIGSSIRGWT